MSVFRRRKTQFEIEALNRSYQATEKEEEDRNIVQTRPQN